MFGEEFFNFRNMFAVHENPDKGLDAVFSLENDFRMIIVPQDMEAEDMGIWIFFHSADADGIFRERESDGFRELPSPVEDEKFGDYDEKSEKQISLPDGDQKNHRRGDDGQPIPFNILMDVVEFRRVPGNMIF